MDTMQICTSRFAGKLPSSEFGSFENVRIRQAAAMGKEFSVLLPFDYDLPLLALLFQPPISIT
jgi:hypothetical protein